MTVEAKTVRVALSDAPGNNWTEDHTADAWFYTGDGWCSLTRDGVEVVSYAHRLVQSVRFVDAPTRATSDSECGHELIYDAGETGWGSKCKKPAGHKDAHASGLYSWTRARS